MNSIICLIALLCITVATCSYTINPTITTWEQLHQCDTGNTCLYNYLDPQVIADTNGLFVSKAWFQWSVSDFTSLPNSAELTLYGCQSVCGCSPTCQETGSQVGANLTMYNATSIWSGITLTGCTASGCPALPTIYNAIGSAVNAANGEYILNMTTFARTAYNSGFSTFTTVLVGTTIEKENCYCSIHATKNIPVINVD